MLETNRKPYQKPTIVRHSVGVVNKFGRPPGAIPMTRIEGYEIRELTEKFGSPLFVLAVSQLRDNYRNLERAFKTRYPRFQIAYSYKTNYLKSVCSILHKEGAYAEVVSGMEYAMARSLGVPGEQIVFNGPYKTREELHLAITEGAMINMDNYDELVMLESLADEFGRQLEVGIRVNMNVNDPPWVKFGFNVEAGHAYEAIKRAMSGGKLKIVGIHSHTGTYVDDVSVYRNAALGLVGLYAKIRELLGVKLKYWDIGGGYASRNTLNWAYLPGEQTCPTFDQYAEVICPILMNGPFAPADAPKLFIEPGRALVDEPFSLITTVAAEKRLPSGTRAIILDAGMNILSSIQWYRYDIRTAQDVGTMMEDTVVYGGLCMNIDVINASCSLPPLRRGDYLVIPHVGAYNLSQSMQFIFTRPAVIAIDGGELYLIKEHETLEYVHQLDRVPEKFRL